MHFRCVDVLFVFDIYIKLVLRSPLLPLARPCILIPPESTSAQKNLSYPKDASQSTFLDYTSSSNNAHLDAYSCSSWQSCQITLLVPQKTLHYNHHIISYHIISYHIISYHIISYHIISYHIISYHIISYHIISYHIISYHIYRSIHPSIHPSIHLSIYLSIYLYNHLKDLLFVSSYYFVVLLLLHPVKFNIAPEKWWLEDFAPFGNSLFSGGYVKSPGCMLFLICSTPKMSWHRSCMHAIAARPSFPALRCSATAVTGTGSTMATANGQQRCVS